MTKSLNIRDYLIRTARVYQSSIVWCKLFRSNSVCSKPKAKSTTAMFLGHQYKETNYLNTLRKITQRKEPNQTRLEPANAVGSIASEDKIKAS